MGTFRWWHTEDGAAVAYPDTRAVQNRVNHETGWFGTIEGCILHGGVRAYAFVDHTESVYDAHEWVNNGKRVYAGMRKTRTITAQRD